MAKSKSIDSIITEAEQTLLFWEENPTLALGSLTLESFRTRIADTRAKRARLQQLRAEEAAAANDLNAQAAAVSAEVTRVRSGVRAIYGPDSNQYEQVGGTRASERKRPARRTETGDAAP